MKQRVLFILDDELFLLVSIDIEADIVVSRNIKYFEVVSVLAVGDFEDPVPAGVEGNILGIAEGRAGEVVVHVICDAIK